MPQQHPITPYSTVAVFLLAYGGPLSLDDVEPYLLDVRHGRPTPQELVEEVRERYRLIGGKSPLLDHTRAQAQALEAWLNQQRAGTFKTFVGMRHWHPYIHEVLPEILEQGIQRIVALPMAPHYSRMSIGAYRHALEKALEGQGYRPGAEPHTVEAPHLTYLVQQWESGRNGRPPTLDVAFIARWSTYPGFIQAVASKVEEALRGWEGSRPVVVFTAHSLPQKVVEQGDPYAQELKESARRVAEKLGLERWQVAYQSAGASAVPWLGPDVGDVVRDLARQGVRDVLVVPIGFVCDHVEILYDIDIELQAIARELGVRLRRTVSLNDDPAFIQALGGMVASALERMLRLGAQQAVQRTRTLSQERGLSEEIDEEIQDVRPNRAGE